MGSATSVRCVVKYQLCELGDACERKAVWLARPLAVARRPALDAAPRRIEAVPGVGAEGPE